MSRQGISTILLFMVSDVNCQMLVTISKKPLSSISVSKKKKKEGKKQKKIR
jgi:hypothetical protein